MFAHMCIKNVIRQSGIDIDAERKLLWRENVNAIDKLIIYKYIYILLPIQKMQKSYTGSVLCIYVYNCKSVHTFWKDCTC